MTAVLLIERLSILTFFAYFIMLFYISIDGMDWMWLTFFFIVINVFYFWLTDHIERCFLYLEERKYNDEYYIDIKDE